MNVRRSGPTIIAILVALLMIAHQDNWYWNDGTLVFGFMPIGLFYHACLSIAATLTWLLATKIAWPVETIEQTEAAVPGTRNENEQIREKENRQ